MKEVSCCCHADIRIAGTGEWDDEGAILYYECKDCNRVCDSILIEDEDLVT